VASTPLAGAVRAAERALRRFAPELVDDVRGNLARAADTVSRRLLGAVVREGLVDPGDLVADRHAFGRIEVRSTGGMPGDPALLLRRLVGADAGTGPVADELVDATVNLALAYARRARLDAALAYRGPGGSRDLVDVAAALDLDADEHAAFFERFATEGHNLHPCSRTRLGWSMPDLLAYDLESASVPIEFVGVRRDVHIGDDLGRDLVHHLAGAAGLREVDRARYAVTPVHAWQAARIRHGRYADLVGSRILVPLDVRLDATPTAALRTLLLPRSVGDPRYLKLSLDIQVTSTRRTISIASTRNGPGLSMLLASILAGMPEAGRVLLMAESSGSGAHLSGGRERDFSAITRTGLAGRLGPGEIAVPGSALYATSPVTGTPVVAELVDRFAETRRNRDRSSAALEFLEMYARLLLPPVLNLATRHGIGLEAHLQNCVPTFVGGVPHRLGLRDLAGMRIHWPRLEGVRPLWPGSVIVTTDPDVMRAKVSYTALQAHLGEVVVRLVQSHGLDEAAAWGAVRRVVDEVYDGLRSDPRLTVRAAEDHAFITAPTAPHKALLAMRLASGRGEAGDIYVPVENALR
jgi:siderophore synthetase component